MPSLDFTVRYYHLTRRGRITESEFHHRELSWQVPVSQVALVLVDVWSDLYVTTHRDRSRQITLDRILPVLDGFREMDGTVIHAPSPACAKRYPQWSQFAGDTEVFGSGPGGPGDSWPPKAFRNKSDDYDAYARPQDPKDQVFDDIIENRSIVPEAEPKDGDFVIATGDQLHRLLKHRGILFLLYAGFAANMCVPFRDYGMRAMKNRGYEVVLLRDCTSAIEVADTYEDMLLSRAAVVDVEQTIGYTAASEDIVKACQAART
jgi:nicotinamidase-related amidase